MDEQKQQYAEAIYYSTVFGIAAVASYCRIYANGDFDSWTRRMAFAFISGTISFGIVAIGRDTFGDSWLGGTAWLGVSAILGLSATETERARKHIVGAISQALVDRIRSILGTPRKTESPDKQDSGS